MEQVGQSRIKATPGAGAGRRGRPNADRVAAIDRDIRTAALRLFLETGLEATSMDAVAAAARVSKGTLYARYQSKEDLFRALMETELERWSARAGVEDHLLPDELEPRLRYYARSLIRIFGWTDYPQLTKLIDSAATAFPDVARLWHEIATRNYVRFLAARMAEAVGAPTDGAVDWEFLATLFLYTIAGWYRAEASLGTVTQEEAAAFSDKVIQTMLASIHGSVRRGG